METVKTSFPLIPSQNWNKMLASLYPTNFQNGSLDNKKNYHLLPWYEVARHRLPVEKSDTAVHPWLFPFTWTCDNRFV